MTPVATGEAPAVASIGGPQPNHEIRSADGLAGLDPAELAARFGTPAYLYDFDCIARRQSALRAALPKRVDIAYAVKANPALAVVDLLGRLGAGADVASAGELATALAAGVDPRRIVMTGPGKRDDELAAAVRAGIRAVTVESLGELGRLEALAAARPRDVAPVPVMLRLAVRADAGFERTRLVGDDGAGKFGMDRSDVREGAARIARSPHLRLVGLHAFGASNVLDADTLLTHARATVRAARELAAETRLPLEVIDVGGGLGIAYADGEEPLDIDALGVGYARLIDELAADPLLARARLLVEPGRWLVGPAGAYLSRVVDRKVVNGREVAILDGGIHHVLRPALVRQEHRLAAFPGASTANTAGPEGRSPRPVTIAGPLCSGLDVLARNVECGDLGVGALVAILDVGAYGFTESIALFLSHPIPPEIAIRGGRAEVIRPRQEPEEWLRRQVVPRW